MLHLHACRLLLARLSFARFLVSSYACCISVILRPGQCGMHMRQAHWSSLLGMLPQAIELVQGEATAALAEIASRNKAHLPEAPLQDAASGPPIRPLGDILTNARLRRRLALLLTLWPLSWLLFLGMTFLVAARLPGRAPINLLLCFAVDGAAVAAAAPLMERLGRCSVCAAMLMLGEAPQAA